MNETLSPTDIGMGGLEPTDPMEAARTRQLLEAEEFEGNDPNHLPTAEPTIVIQATATTVQEAKRVVGGALGVRSVPQMEIAPGITGRDPTRS